MSDKSDYRSILKITSIMGSVQVFNIIIVVARSKIIALLLGPIGIGITGLFNTTLDLFASITGAGIGESAVKEISFSNKGDRNSRALDKKTQLIIRLSWYFAFLGCVTMIIFSKWLSEFVFDSHLYRFAFIWLSLALFFKQLAQVNLSILRGFRVFVPLAKANVFGSLVSLLVTIPLYYYLHLKAIVPAIIISYIISFIISFYFQKKTNYRFKQINIINDLTKGKDIVKLGVLLSFSGIVSTITIYVFQIYLTRISTLEIVGFYIAGVAILNNYVNVLFNSMGTDYYPRLAAIHNDNIKVIKTIQQQALLTLLIITPIITIFIALAPVFVEVLYSSKFFMIIEFLKWGILGILFKSVSWSVGYAFIAKGDSKVFLKTTVIFNLLFLGLNILGYRYYGLQGLGMAFLLYYIIHLLSVYIIARLRYDFYFKTSFYKLFISAFFLCLSVFLCTFIGIQWYRNISLISIVLLSIIFTFYHLNKVINLKELLKSKKS